MNVLVVDDDREIVDSTSIFLSGEGYKALKAYDGIEALDILSENEAHLMILDIMMPKPNGIKTLMKLRESREAKGDGLGLAIAKSYTEICDGTFDIVVDGNMVKAILKFKKYS